MALPLSPSPSARAGAEWRRAGPGVAAVPGRRNRRLPSPSRWHRGPGAGGEAIAGRPLPPGRGRAAGGGEGGGIAPAGLPPPHPAFPQSSGRERGGDRSQLVPDPFIRRRSRRLSQPPRVLLIGGTELGPVSAPLLPARTMEFAQRKRSRKSQSFKLVNEDYHHEIYKISDYNNDVNGETKETQPAFLGEIPMVNSSVGPNCCTCNCQSTLQAILQELKTMRKLMQLQTVGTQNRQQPPVPLICAQKSSMSRKRNKKRKLPLKAVETVTMNKKPSSPENEKRLTANSEPSSLPAIEPPLKPETPGSGFGIILESASSDPEVQLAEGFDVFMPKSQLDSILSNYTRSGSLLFRKLVCAFFDDKTLANSLPNGKRKRGLNDNRKGLDQNIVGAIKVFTEKYCTANHVDKLPGPRDWVQILQDQIKLARRRLKRGSAETTDCDEKPDISLLQTGNLFDTTTDHLIDANPDFSV
ncbi:BEN domain-containing protein 7 isoform X3 [Oenanthe melanoleuca]|uniref:BEN domain-containing protein 7 isoform X3 n=1 Tax=Oenanthe melanoleuca TaxID=2939378 RepID=UPI0024C1608D|nr:BEN domain-containing protein 7 isoform X3 [Oenanthe melanoleuca]